MVIKRTPIKIFKNEDFSHYALDIDYDVSNDCENEGCDSICRCGKIINTRVKSVSIEGLLETRNLDKIDKYCVDRLLRIFKVYDTSKYEWDVDVCGGYYGQEVKGASLVNPTLLLNAINHALRLKTTTEKVEYLLKTEYGYLLDELKGCTYEIMKVKKKNVFIGNKDYSKKIDTFIYNKNTYKLPVCVALALDMEGGDDDTYRLIDGHHRYLSIDKKTIEIIAAFSGEKDYSYEKRPR